jgi:P-type Ca2+ transporter type 2C
MRPGPRTRSTKRSCPTSWPTTRSSSTGSSSATRPRRRCSSSATRPFLGATLLDIAGGEPFSSPQVLWIHFLVSAPFGVALGLDLQTPGLMSRRPRPSGESIATPSLKLTAGLVGLYMAVVLDALIHLGKAHYGSTAIGSSIGLTAFALMIVVAAYESRGVTSTTLRSETFDNRALNLTALAEIAVAVFATQTDALNRLLGTVSLDAGQFGLALSAAAGLFVLWEAGKLVARRRPAGAR